jgi:hypothetical protein
MMLAGFSCSRADDRGKATEHLNFTLVLKEHKSISDLISCGIPDPSMTSALNYYGVVEVCRACQYIVSCALSCMAKTEK